MVLRKKAASDVTWRDKYLELNHQFETLKQSSCERDRMISKAFSLTSVMAQGQSVSVDEAIAGIKTALRDDDELVFQKQIEELDRQTLSFDHAFQVESERLSSRIRAMADTLLKHKFSPELASFISELRSTSGDALQSWDGYSRQLNGWARVLNYLAKQKLSIAPVPEHSPGQQDKAPPSEAHDIPLRKLADVLDGLIARLVIPDDLVPRSQQLRESLKTVSSVDRLVALFEDVALFMFDCQDGRNEFERFLESLDNRLQAIQEIVADANESQSERETARQELDHMVRHQIEDIRNGVKNTDAVSATIRDHLQYIVKAMESYHHQETEREHRLSSQLQQLQSRLTEMETEAAEAKAIIEDQKNMVITDHLTGLPNRAAYESRLAEELTKRQRSRKPLSLIVCDIDHFKSINDTFGHLAGDKVLQLLSGVMRKNVSGDDLVVRYGGEEFVILLPGRNGEDALGVAEKLRLKIEACPFNFSGKPLTVTMSFGVSEFHALEAPETVFERADKALYDAKKTRNRSVRR